MKGSVVLTADGKVLHCSPSWLVATGETEDNVVGHVLLEVEGDSHSPFQSGSFAPQLLPKMDHFW